MKLWSDRLKPHVPFLEVLKLEELDLHIPHKEELNPVDLSWCLLRDYMISDNIYHDDITGINYE